MHIHISFQSSRIDSNTSSPQSLPLPRGLRCQYGPIQHSVYFHYRCLQAQEYIFKADQKLERALSKNEINNVDLHFFASVVCIGWSKKAVQRFGATRNRTFGIAKMIYLLTNQQSINEIQVIDYESRQGKLLSKRQ